MLIRRAGPEDGPVLAHIFYEAVMRGAAADYSVTQRQAWAGPGPDVSKWSDQAALIQLWLAEIGDTPVGFSGLHGHSFEYLFVHPDAQRRGVARALHDHLVKQAVDAGQTQLITFASHSARPFFSRLGWDVVRSNRAERRGVWLENTKMCRAIT